MTSQTYSIQGSRRSDRSPPEVSPSDKVWGSVRSLTGCPPGASVEIEPIRRQTRQPIPVLCLTLLLVVSGGCGPSRPNAVPGPRNLSGLRITCEPVDAQLFVNDAYMGETKGLDRTPIMLREGVHRIEIRRSGYFSYFATVRVARGVGQGLHVRLRKEPF